MRVGAISCALRMIRIEIAKAEGGDLWHALRNHQFEISRTFAQSSTTTTSIAIYSSDPLRVTRLVSLFSQNLRKNRRSNSTAHHIVPPLPPSFLLLFLLLLLAVIASPSLPSVTAQHISSQPLLFRSLSRLTTSHLGRFTHECRSRHRGGFD